MKSDKIDTILKNHEKWLNSNHTEGEQASFEGKVLRKPNFLKAKLDNSNFKEAKLNEAFLIGASFKNANFENAYLSHSYLGTCNFNSANLTNVDLSNSILLGTDLSSADLTNANLVEVKEIQEAIFHKTIFNNTIVDTDNFNKLKKILNVSDLDGFIVIELSKDAQIKREIHFAPQHLQAGLSLLNYFGKIVSEKYSNTPINVIIKQNKNRVTLIIETDDGTKEMIEKELDKYGEVIKGDLSVEEYSSNPLKIMELEKQLEIAYQQIENHKEIRQLEDEKNFRVLNESSARIKNLEDEVKWLRVIVSDGIIDYRKKLSELTLNFNENDDVKKLLIELKEIIDEKGTEGIKEDKRTKTIGKKLKELLVTETISGATGEVISSIFEALTGFFLI